MGVENVQQPSRKHFDENNMTGTIYNNLIGKISQKRDFNTRMMGTDFL